MPTDGSPGADVAALLLSGGASTRMGCDKTQLVILGMTLVRRAGQLLERVVDLALEIGPGSSGLPAIRESPAGPGPLAAICAGRRARYQMVRTTRSPGMAWRLEPRG
jgi:molybdopterin-guanine dinucleotide biosynthesis protein A